MSVYAAMLRILLSLAAGAALAGAWVLIMSFAAALPPQTRLVELDISLNKGDSVILGRAELAQKPGGPTAEQHLAIARSADAIRAYDVSAERRVGFSTARRSYGEFGEIAIPEGRSVFLVGGLDWEANRRGAQLDLTPAGGVTSTVAPGDVMGCWLAASDWLSNCYQAAERFVQGARSNYQLGGNRVGTADPRRVADPRLPIGAATVSYSSGEWYLISGSRLVELPTDRGPRSAQSEGLVLVDADGVVAVQTLTIGRTRYGVAYDMAASMLRLRPLQRPAWLDPALVEPLPAGGVLSRQMVDPPARQFDAERLKWAGLGGLAVIALFVALLGLRELRAVAAFGLAITGLALVLTPAGGLPWVFIRAAGWGLVATGIAAPGRMALGLLGLPNIRAGSTLRLFLVAFAAAAIGGAMVVTEAILRPAELQVVGVREITLAGTWLALLAPLLSAAMTVPATTFWALLTPIAAFGMAAGVRLTALEGGERWKSLLDLHLLSFAAIGTLATVVVLAAGAGSWTAIRKLVLPTRRWRLVLRIVGVIAGLASVGITFVSTETGFWGLFQPSEMAKSLLVMLVAFTLVSDLARRRMLPASQGGLNVAAPFLAVALAVAILFTSAVNYDMSPIIVCGAAMLVAFGAGTLLHASQLHRRRTERRLDGLPVPRPARAWQTLEMPAALRLAAREIRLRSTLWPVAVLSVVVVGLTAGAAWLLLDPAFREHAAVPFFDPLVTPWRRLQSWYDLRLASADRLVDMPETGQQLRLAREALLQAHCSLGQLLCPAGVPTEPGGAATEALLRVPAIQNDFAAVSLVHALGIDGALLYAAAQAALVGTTMTVGLMTLFGRNDFRIGNWVAGCTLIGLSALVGAQMLLAWGNVLGFFPVMGQPMTFVSFGASHHLAVVIPLATFSLICASLLGSEQTSSVSHSNPIYRRRVTS
jgi:cell division protein FtsW (lipid II flippase)